MRLIKGWRASWKFHSVRAMAVVAVLPAAWVSLPPDLKDAVPDSVLPWVTSVIMIAGIVGRLKDQGYDR